MSPCPCQSGKEYDACCGPLISGSQAAPTAEAYSDSAAPSREGGGNHADLWWFAAAAAGIVAATTAGAALYARRRRDGL